MKCYESLIIPKTKEIRHIHCLCIHKIIYKQSERKNGSSVLKPYTSKQRL